MDYAENKELLAELFCIGRQIEGYNFTLKCNQEKWEKGKWDSVLETRKENLNNDIQKLITMIKETY